MIETVVYLVLCFSSLSSLASMSINFGADMSATKTIVALESTGFHLRTHRELERIRISLLCLSGSHSRSWHGHTLEQMISYSPPLSTDVADNGLPNEIYLSPDNTDTDCNTHCRSVGRAYSVSATPRTIYLDPGDYEQGSQVNMDSAGTMSIVGSSRTECFLSKANTNVNLFTIGQANTHLTFRYLTIQLSDHSSNDYNFFTSTFQHGTVNVSVISCIIGMKDELDCIHHSEFYVTNNLLNLKFDDCVACTIKSVEGYPFIYCPDICELSLSNSKFFNINNTNSDGRGSVFYCGYASTLKLTDCSFVQCRSGKYHGVGGVSPLKKTESAPSSIQNCIFYDCYAASTEGVIWISSKEDQKASITIANTSFHSAHAGGSSGALSLRDHLKPTLSACSFYNCHVGSGNGGAVGFISGAVANIQRCTFVNCYTTSGKGGALSFDGSNGTFAYCVFVNCYAQTKTNKQGNDCFLDGSSTYIWFGTTSHSTNADGHRVLIDGSAKDQYSDMINDNNAYSSASCSSTWGSSSSTITNRVCGMPCAFLNEACVKPSECPANSIAMRGVCENTVSVSTSCSLSNSEIGCASRLASTGTTFPCAKANCYLQLGNGGTTADPTYTAICKTVCTEPNNVVGDLGRCKYTECGSRTLVDKDYSCGTSDCFRQIVNTTGVLDDSEADSCRDTCGKYGNTEIDTSSNAQCKLMPCASRQAGGTESWECGPNSETCYQQIANTTGMLDIGENSCRGDCGKYGNTEINTDGNNGQCRLIACASREAGGTGSWECGPIGETNPCYQQIDNTSETLDTGLSSCRPDCNKYDNTQPGNNGQCKLKECASRQATGSGSWECGYSGETPPCLKQPDGSAAPCNTTCPKFSNEISDVCVPQNCASRTPAEGLTCVAEFETLPIACYNQPAGSSSPCGISCPPLTHPDPSNWCVTDCSPHSVPVLGSLSNECQVVPCVDRTATAVDDDDDDDASSSSGSGKKLSCSRGDDLTDCLYLADYGAYGGGGGGGDGSETQQYSTQCVISCPVSYGKVNHSGRWFCKKIDCSLRNPTNGCNLPVDTTNPRCFLNPSSGVCVEECPSHSAAVGVVPVCVLKDCGNRVPNASGILAGEDGPCSAGSFYAGAAGEGEGGEGEGEGEEDTPCFVDTTGTGCVPECPANSFANATLFCVAVAAEEEKEDGGSDQKSQSKNSSSFPWWIIVIAVAVVSMTLCVICLIVFKRRKKKEKEEELEDDGLMLDDEEEEGSKAAAFEEYGQQETPGAALATAEAPVEEEKKEISDAPVHFKTGDVDFEVFGEDKMIVDEGPDLEAIPDFTQIAPLTAFDFEAAKYDDVDLSIALSMAPSLMRSRGGGGTVHRSEALVAVSENGAQVPVIECDQGYGVVGAGMPSSDNGLALSSNAVNLNDLIGNNNGDNDNNNYSDGDGKKNESGTESQLTKPSSAEKNTRPEYTAAAAASTGGNTYLDLGSFELGKGLIMPAIGPPAAGSADTTTTTTTRGKKGVVAKGKPQKKKKTKEKKANLKDDDDNDKDSAEQGAISTSTPFSAPKQPTTVSVDVPNEVRTAKVERLRSANNNNNNNKTKMAQENGGGGGNAENHAFIGSSFAFIGCVS